MKNAEAAIDAVRELQEALNAFIELAEQTDELLQEGGFDQASNQLYGYLILRFKSFADDDPDNCQPGSIGSLLGSIEYRMEVESECK